jgi:hypothetical protein
MSIVQKLFLIPIIGTVGFLNYLGITTFTALKNVDLLENVIEVQYPALDVTKSELVKMEKVRETLSSAVTTGDDETPENAQNFAKETQKLLQNIKSIEPSLSAGINGFLKSFNDYYDSAFENLTKFR